MTHTVGDVRDHRLWVRCPFCGDSDEPTHAHLSVDLMKGFYYCVRCNAGGRLAPKHLFAMAQAVGAEVYVSELGETDQDRELPDLQPGPGNSRGSQLSRYHLPRRDDHGEWDAFQMRDPLYNLVSGIHLRSGKDRVNLGDSGIGWVGEGPLLSSATQPLRVVEGPYDVVMPWDVCVFGFLSVNRLRSLRGHFLTLCPDGDVWTKPDLTRSFLKTLRWSINDPAAPHVLELEVLPDGKDPDEMSGENRIIVRRPEIWKFLQTFRALLR